MKGLQPQQKGDRDLLTEPGIKAEQITSIAEMALPINTRNQYALASLSKHQDSGDESAT